VPRDTVFVRDGRSFDAATDAFADTVLPGPTTIAGAVGAVFRVNPAEVRGPVLARNGADGWEPYFPAPADLVVTTDGSERVCRLAVTERAGHTDLDEHPARDAAGPSHWLMPPENAEPVKPLGGWISGPVLSEYLAGRLPGRDGTPLGELGLENPLVPERRVGLARAGRQVRAGYLYQSTHLRPRDGWGFLAEFTPRRDQVLQASNHSSFGGKGRLADVSAAVMSWPAAGAAGSRVLVYLATPAIWPGGWRMPVPEGAELVAAAAGEPEPAATTKRGREWRDSRALRWAVPAGSVYLLEFGDPGAGAEWAARWHGVALDRGVVAPDEDLLRTAGFGVVLTGAWT
jgi:CRISPR-associated protein Cmr3